MGRIELYTVKDNEIWDEIVKGFGNYDTYYLLGYSKAFSLHGDGEPHLFYYHDDNIKAINVVMKRDISLDKRFTGKIKENKYFDIVTPYGYGGFLIEGETTQESLLKLKEVYEKKCSNENIISEFVRFHPVLNNYKILHGIYDISQIGNTVTINLESKKEIWSNFHGKNRNVVRKAIKSGVKIYWGRDPKLFNEFIRMYNTTMDRDEATDYYYFNEDFYSSILNDLKNSSIIFYAVYENRIISMSIILYSNNQLHYHLSASNRKYQSLAPTNLLLYEVALWGNENGYDTFHLGGGLGGAEDNLYKFKKAFNRYSNTYFSVGKKIFNKEGYDYLIDVRTKYTSNKLSTQFFPLYRG